MDFSADINIKVEKDDLERDANDNFEQLLFDVAVKMEKEAETKEHPDWCITRLESPGELLEPLFFKQLTVPEGQKCAICDKYFSDTNSILRHNLTHLRVLIRNPRLFQCDHCGAFFTDRHKINRHITSHLRSTQTNKHTNSGITYLLTYKPKAFTPKTTDLPFTARYGKTYKAKPKNETIENSKLKDGVTNSLKYKPKSYKKQTVTNHECHICKKVFMYRHWHAHMKEVHGEGGYSCSLCTMEFKCERYFLKHMRNKHGDTSQSKKKTHIPCDECDAILQCKYALKTHKRNVHSRGEHVCGICKSKLKCRSYLLSHMRRVHYDDGKMHVCECGKKFRSPRYLRVHKKNAHSKKK